MAKNYGFSEEVKKGLKEKGLTQEHLAKYRKAMGAEPNKIKRTTSTGYMPNKSWTDKLDKTKYKPETIKRWKADEKRASKQQKELQANPHKDLPMTAPARHAYDSRKKI